MTDCERKMGTAGERSRGVVVVGLLLAALGCSGNPVPGGDEGGTASGGAASIDGAEEAPVSEGGASGSRLPPGFVPPPGQCRVWIPGADADEGAGARGPGQCSALRDAIPEGAWLIYRPPDRPERVRVWQYGAEREVLAQRIYDASTGEIIRHVAPTGD